LGQDTVDVTPYEFKRVRVTIRVPRRTRGFYAAAIIASLKPRQDLISNVAVNVRFLVPVLVQVEGRPLRHKVKLGDMGLEFVQPVRGNPASTNVVMNIDNDGGTRSMIKSFAVVKGFMDGHWREITTAEFRGTGIIPGAKLRLRSSVGRALPAGKYRISGIVYVDGRRAHRTTKEIEFASHPSVTKVAGDAPLDLYPADLTIDVRVGAVRTKSINVFNASDETVNIQTVLAMPRSLENVAFGNLKGKDLDCTGWLRVEPERFTLQSNAERNIRVIATMPENVEMHPCYYAVLGLSSTYPDGQTAGVTTGNICIANEEISIEPFAYGMKLHPAYKEDSEYYIVARFGNFGHIHFTPVRCRAAVIDTLGDVKKMTSLSSRKTGMMLPFEARDYSEVIDFSEVPPGVYRLVAALEYAPGQTSDKQIAIRVLAQGGRRVIEVIQLEEDLGEKIEVKW
jgi:hypothetical protein